jgi:phospholipid/cholesterol/gamma-HCH transport system substrate-binding protein
MSSKVETAVGSIVLAFLMFICIFAWSGHSIKTGDFIIKASFDRADGVHVGTPVKISGVTVGKITNMTLDSKSYQAIIEISLQKILLPKDTSVAVVSEGILGGKYVSISPGTSNKYLENNDLITNTSSSLNFESLIGKFLFGKGGK